MPGDPAGPAAAAPAGGRLTGSLVVIADAEVEATSRAWGVREIGQGLPAQFAEGPGLYSIQHSEGLFPVGSPEQDMTRELESSDTPDHALTTMSNFDLTRSELITATHWFAALAGPRRASITEIWGMYGFISPLTASSAPTGLRLSRHSLYPPPPEGRAAAPRASGGEESPGSTERRCRLMAGGGDPRESATESNPPGFGPARSKGWGKSPPRFR